MTRDTGFTLVELMTVVALTTVLVGAMVGLSDQARRGLAQTTDLARELEGFRTVLDQLTRDVRQARAVAVGEGGYVSITTGNGERLWTWDDGMLVREADGRRREVARAVRELRVEPDGRLWRITLVVGRGTPLHTAVLPRVEVGR